MADYSKYTRRDAYNQKKVQMKKEWDEYSELLEAIKGSDVMPPTPPIMKGFNDPEENAYYEQLNKLESDPKPAAQVNEATEETKPETDKEEKKDDQ